MKEFVNNPVFQYYLDELGSIEEQKQFLDSLNITEFQFCEDSTGTYFQLICHKYVESTLYSYIVVIRHSRSLSFVDDTSLMLIYLISKGFRYASKVVNFKFSKSCVEDTFRAAVEATADAGSASPIVESECGNS